MNWDNVDTVNVGKEDSLDPQFWVLLFKARPEALYSLLYDVYVTKKGKLGRGRRRKINGNLEELWSLIYGEES